MQTSCSSSKKNVAATSSTVVHPMVNNAAVTPPPASSIYIAKELAWYLNNAPFKMPAVTVPSFSNNSFSIKDYGGVNDGKKLNTTAFETAINACVQAGGGKVIVPAGVWLTGLIQLQSNINLEVQKGATILFTKDRSQFPIVKSSTTSTSFQTASPIYGYDLKNIAITGEGVIDGGGDSWRPVKKGKVTAAEWANLVASGGVLSDDEKIWWPSLEAKMGELYTKNLKQKTAKSTAADYLPARDFLRPNLLFLSNCENILIDKVTIRNSPKFLFYPNKCKNLTISNAHFFNEWNAQNGDAIDISACENVIIYNTTVSAGDDGICMKSSRGKTDVMDSYNLQNIVIAGCTVYRGHGGFVIGSNTDGAMKNIFVTDCNFIGTDIGVRVKSNAGRGGVVKDIFVSNIYMKDIIHEAILFDTYYEDVPVGAAKETSKSVKDKTPMFSDFRLNNIYCDGAETAVSITGLPEMPISKLYFNNIIINANNSFTASDATDLKLDAVKILSPSNIVYKLNNVQGFNLSEGYLPKGAKKIIKADKKSTLIKVENTDLHNVNNAIDIEGN